MFRITECLSQCFGATSKPAVSETPNDVKYVNKLRKNLGKPEPQRLQPIELVATPADAFSSSSTRAPPTTRFPVKPAVAPKPESGNILTRDTLAEVLNEIDKIVPCRYAISGLTALIDHGFTGRGAKSVSILVPAHSKDIVRPWAQTNGGKLSAVSPDRFEVRLPSDGSYRPVRIRYLNKGFDELQIVQSNMSAAKVLSLTSQLELMATAFVKECKQGKAPQPKTEAEEARVRTIVEDIYWALGWGIEQSRPLDPRYLKIFLSSLFWEPLIHYVGEPAREAMLLAVRAGVDLGHYLAREAEEKRRNADVRDHDDFLRQYNVPGLGVVATQPGPFEDMRGLGRRDLQSIYTVQSKDSRSELGAASAGSSVVGSSRRPPPGPSKLHIQERVSLDEGLRRSRTMAGRGSRSSSSVRPVPNQNKSRTSIDLVNGTGTPSDWL
ncbi:hypothetical protein JX265_006150 [Neoarthrinium moseri]|uniref:Uncharacterized protein n=1 Tax=Neoarthrinium moseri TaxID=1658444 RepID=A0A9Q0AQV6_9PEZI|nr:hypothetical protein JX265_006150 [Neoarthrinium moseri]